MPKTNDGGYLLDENYMMDELQRIIEENKRKKTAKPKDKNQESPKAKDKSEHDN